MSLAIVHSRAQVGVEAPCVSVEATWPTACLR